MTQICRLCGATALKIGEKNAHDIYRCPSCRFVMAVAQGEDRSRAHYDDYGGTPMYRAKIEKKLKRSGKRIRRYAHLAGGKRFLDVGCSIGIAAEAARRAGFDATGIDLDDTAIGEAKTLFPDVTYRAVLAEDFAAEGHKFDFIYSSEVIEHIADPVSTLRAIKTMLAPGGVVWITTPDSGHPRVPKDFFSWNELCPPNHLSLFTRKNIKAAMAGCGLAIKKYEFNFKPGIKLVAQHA